MTVLKFDLADALTKRDELYAQVEEYIEDERCEFYAIFLLLKQHADQSVLYRGLLDDIEKLIEQRVKETHFDARDKGRKSVLKAETFKAIRERLARHY